VAGPAFSVLVRAELVVEEMQMGRVNTCIIFYICSPATCFYLGHPWTILSFTSRLLDTSGNSLKLPPRSRVQANAQPGYWIGKIGHSAVPANVEGSSHAQKAHTLVGTQNSLADWQISANRADLEPWLSPKPQVNTM